MIRILGIAGSIRRDSYNKALLNEAAMLLPTNAEMKIFDIGKLPLFNQDLEADLPDVVKEFKNEVEKCDALLIATPEYNRSVPGVLKNAIDWASRPPGQNSFDGKPVATMGASTGSLGTAVVQYHLREIFAFLNMHPVEKPSVFVANADKKIKNGRVIDEETRKRIGELIENLVKWAIKIGVSDAK